MLSLLCAPSTIINGDSLTCSILPVQVTDSIPCIISEDEEFTYRYKDYELETLMLNMLGEHQKENAALAITALIELNEAGNNHQW